MSFAELSQHSEFVPPPETLNKPNIAFGVYLPKEILTNQEIESWGVVTPGGKPLTAESIQKRTGIVHRYVADEKEDPLFMGLNAAQQALNGKKADVVIVSTSFPVGFNLSKRISEELGLADVPNLDVYAACSGFTLGLACIKVREQEFLDKKILFVATEEYSPYLHDLRDKEGELIRDPSLAQTIFSGGATAMVFKHGKEGIQVLSTLNEHLAKDAENPIKMPIGKTPLTPPFIAVLAPKSKSGKFEQDGAKVYELICKTVPQLIKKTIDEANLDPSQKIKMVVPHQGSGHMVEGISRRLNGYSVYRDFAEGNFSSASIPRALNKALEKGEIKKGDIVVLAGFGAGLFASIAVVQFG